MRIHPALPGARVRAILADLLVGSYEPLLPVIGDEYGLRLRSRQAAVSAP